MTSGTILVTEMAHAFATKIGSIFQTAQFIVILVMTRMVITFVTVMGDVFVPITGIYYQTVLVIVLRVTYCIITARVWGRKFVTLVGTTKRKKHVQHTVGHSRVTDPVIITVVLVAKKFV